MDKRRFKQRLRVRFVPTCLKHQVSDVAFTLDSIGSSAGLLDRADPTQDLCLRPNHYDRRPLEIPPPSYNGVSRQGCVNHPRSEGPVRQLIQLIGQHG